MDIFNNKNVYVYTENDTVFILPKAQDKPVKICYEDPNRRIVANNDGSITIEDTVSLEWLANHIVDKEDYEKVCIHTWRVAEHGKYLRSADQENVAFHRLVTDFKWKIVDHKDRDVTNCRKNNLREASPAENRHNMSLAKNNTTGVIGVYKEIKPSGTLTWRARIACNGYIYRKTWHSFEDAVKDRLQKEKELFGDFAPQKHLFSQYGIETN